MKKCFVQSKKFYVVCSRVLGLNENCEHPLLRFFHSSAMNLQKLTELWVSLTLKLFKNVIVNERYLIIGDGIKIAKSGKKMTAVKGLHQVSSSNTKPEFIMGHYRYVSG